MLHEYSVKWINEQITKLTVLSYIPGGEGDTLKHVA